MKAQLLIWLMLLALPVQAKTEHERFMFSDWQVLSNEIVILPHPPRRPVQLTASDLGAILVCRPVSGRQIYERIVTREFLDSVVEKGVLIYCAKDGARVLYVP